MDHSVKLPGIAVIALGFLLVASSFNTSLLSSIKLVGLSSIVILLSVSSLILLVNLARNHRLPRKLLGILICSAILITVYLIALLIEGITTRGVIVFGQLVLVIIFFICMSFIKWDKRKIRIIANIIAIFALINLSLFAISGFITPFKSFTGNSNAFSALFLFLGFFPLLYALLIKQPINKIIWLVIFSINILLAFSGQARSIWIAFFIFVMVFICWRFITVNRIMFYGTFAVIIVFLISVTVFYPMIGNHSDAVIWNEIIRNYTGKNLFSGREDIWLALIELIKQRLLIGYGASASPQQFLPIGLSSHNLYLQIALQSGLTGLALLILLFWNIWKLFYRKVDSIYVKLAASFFVAAMVYQLFEVSLTQNNLAIGILIWLITSIGVSKSIERNYADGREPT